MSLRPEVLSPLIRESDLARRWNKSIRTMQRRRRQQAGPPWFRIGATIYYRIEDVLTYEQAGLRQSEVKA
jgi:hypothetical protein